VPPTQLTFTGSKRVIVSKTVTVSTTPTVVKVTVMNDGDGVAENVTTHKIYRANSLVRLPSAKLAGRFRKRGIHGRCIFCQRHGI